MIQSRLFFLLLILSYLGVTPASVYTCACFMPVETAWQQLNVDEIVEEGFATNTAVASLLFYFSLTFMVAAAFTFLQQRPNFFGTLFTWLKPYVFYDPPPTPPPHFA